MARIAIGIGASHSTLMNTNWYSTRDQEGARRFRDGLESARRRLEATAPDIAIIIGSNHFRGFWLDLIPSFTIGVGEVIASGEAGTPSGPQRVAPEYAQALANALINNGIDIAISARLQIDHGQTHAIQYLLPGLDIPVVPLVVHVFATPLPTVARCVEVGRALRAAVAVLPDNLRVAVIASGGLSHDLPWPSDWTEPSSEDESFLVEAWLNGRDHWKDYEERRREIIVGARPHIYEEFDRAFLQALVDGQLADYAALSSEDIARRAGNGGHELRTWLMMAAAMDFASGEQIAYSAMDEWLTGMAVAAIS